MAGTIVTLGDLKVHLRPLKSEELPLVMELVRQVGWQKTREDVHDMYSGDPRSLWGAFTEQGALLCTLGGVVVGESTLVLGLYMACRTKQGMGVGILLTDYFFEINKGVLFIGNSVLSMADKYGKHGFTRRTDDHMVRFTIPKESLVAGASPGLDTAMVAVSPITEENIAKVFLYDEELSHTNRQGFLRRWLLSPSAASACAMIDGRVRGFICLRRIATTFPALTCFYGDDLDVATQLLRHIVALDVTGGKDIACTYNSNNTANVAVLVCDRMALCDREYFDQKSRPYTVRLSTGAEVLSHVDWQKVYAVGPTDCSVI